MTKARTLADNFAADINGITAGTGITGGGTSGTVTVTNSMATEIDAKGDLVVGTGADTFARLAVASTAGYLLAVDSTETTGLKWAAPAAAGTWAAWTPSYTNLTKGNGTETARYIEIDSTVFFFYKLIFGSTSSMGSGPQITLPVNVKSGQDQTQIYSNIRDAGTATFEGSWTLDSTNHKMFGYAVSANGTYSQYTDITASVPMSWTTNDFFCIFGWYEKA